MVHTMNLRVKYKCEDCGLVCYDKTTNIVYPETIAVYIVMHKCKKDNLIKQMQSDVEDLDA